MMKELNELLKQIGANFLKRRNKEIIRSNPFSLELGKSLSYLQDANILTQVNFNLLAEHSNICDLEKLLSQMQKSGLLNQANFNLIIEHPNVRYLSMLISLLIEADLFNQKNFNAVLQKKDLKDLDLGLLELQEAGLLNQENFNSILQHPQVENLGYLINSLQKMGLLNQDNLSILFSKTNLIALRQSFGLFESTILNQDSFIALVQLPVPHWLYAGLVGLDRDKILTPENRLLLMESNQPLDLSQCLILLNEAHILTDENKTILVEAKNIKDLKHGLLELKTLGLLNQDNFILVAKHQTPSALASLLSELKEFNLTPEIRQILFKHLFPYNLVDGIKLLKRSGLFNEENFLTLAQHENSVGLVSGLSRLAEAELFINRENFLALSVHSNPLNLANALNNLNQSGILTAENREALIKHDNPTDLARMFLYLNPLNLLTPQNRIAIASPAHAMLLSEHAFRLIWARIPRGRLTQIHFQRLLDAAPEDIRRVANQIIEEITPTQAPVGAGAQTPMINQQQSTHTASVHRSVSQSAKNLFARYGQTLSADLVSEIQMIKAEVESLPNTPEYEPVKTCISRITAPDYTFLDVTSNLSIHQLLVLAYKAIHDAENRKDSSEHPVSLEDAKALFFKGLFEIQRGYNLDEHGRNIDGPDSPICTAGAFNKIIEKLHGIHQDVSVLYITREGASLKFPFVAREKAVAFLTSIASTDSPLDYQTVKALLSTIKQEQSLRSIWSNINAQVKEELWDEFKEVYQGSLGKSLFEQMLSCFEDIDIPDLQAIEELLERSKGRAIPSSRGHGLWSRTDDLSNPSPEEPSPVKKSQ